MKDHIVLNVNGEAYAFSLGKHLGQVPYSETLVQTLRERLGLTGTKQSCNHGACGCCAVLANGRAIASCMTLTAECDGAQITTIEGLADPVSGELDPVQQAILDYSAFQCGFCTPGIIIAAKAILSKNPHPTEDEIKEGLSGNFCRCISQYQVIDAIKSIV
ncbi:MAG: (2Fe-2S)-binding protein [Synergistaceae bacterium]|nr:(2Fe-2S)-binding protein [Synergistaceae bacterium]